MMRGRFCWAVGITLALLSAGARAQFVPERYTLTAAERAELETGRDRLAKAVERLAEQARRPGAPAPTVVLLPDVEIYRDALDRTLRQNLFFAARDVDAARKCIQEGERRAADLAEGKAPWQSQPGVVALGYRSAVDGTAQPYQIYNPDRPFGDTDRKERLDVFLHGRAGTLSEVNFLASPGWLRSNFGVERWPLFALYPYGRANNGWRFAGERDCFEALADVQRRFPIDSDQITLRGFSMGGHGTWHIGLQHPGRWAVMSPGAGFTDTKVYQKITEPLPAWQEALLHLYDPVDYAANAANLPVLAYVGDQDPALGQHQQMVARLREENAPFREFIGPMTPHRYEPAVLRTILGEMETPRRKPDAERVDFVTYTLRFPECKWARIEGLERHWQRAEIHAGKTGENTVEVTTKNVTALRLNTGVLTATIDGQRLALDSGPVPTNVAFVKRNGRWAPGVPKGLRKRPGLTGPIDDALFGPVLAVEGTGTPWSEPLDRHLKRELQRFRDGWDQYFRGTLPVKPDRDITPADVRDKNLYLFGDPGSNSVLRRLLPKLPLKWTREGFMLAGQRYPAADHCPVLVFPNPENPERYVVLNVGFSFSRADWEGSNARQYPHLPDYAVVRFDPEKFSDDYRSATVLAGFFDEHWKIAGGS